jgi:hypothetical protein
VELSPTQPDPTKDFALAVADVKAKGAPRSGLDIGGDTYAALGRYSITHDPADLAEANREFSKYFSGQANTETWNEFVNGGAE